MHECSSHSYPWWCIHLRQHERKENVSKVIWLKTNTHTHTQWIYAPVDSLSCARSWSHWLHRYLSLSDFSPSLFFVRCRQKRNPTLDSVQLSNSQSVCFVFPFLNKSFYTKKHNTLTHFLFARTHKHIQNVCKIYESYTNGSERLHYVMRRKNQIGYYCCCCCCCYYELSSEIEIIDHLNWTNTKCWINESNKGVSHTHTETETEKWIEEHVRERERATWKEQ